MSVSSQSGSTAIEPASTEWWLFVVWGVASVVLGALLLFQPVPSALVLVTIVAVLWVIGGIVEVIGAVVQHGQNWGWHLAAGVLGVIVGLFVFANPIVGAIAAVGGLYLLIAFSAFVSGITGFFGGHLSFGRIVLNVLQILLGLLMLVGFFNLINLVLLVQAIGLLTIVGGIAAALSAFHFRHAETASV